MKGFIKWLLGTTDEVVKEARKEKVVELVEEAPVEKVVEVVEEAPVEKFVDEVTGREYKSARSLKSAITRRKNKAAGKTSKKSKK